MLTATEVGEKLDAAHKSLVNTLSAIGDDTPPTEEQKNVINDHKEKIAALKERLELVKEAEALSNELSTPRGEVPAGRGTQAHHIPVHAQPKQADDGKFGYRNYNEFLSDVRDASLTGQVSDRLAMSNAAGSDEQSTLSDPYGGFLSPPGFLPQLLQVGPEGDPTAPGGIAPVTTVPVATTSIDIPARVDKNHSSSVSGGLTVSRRAETQAGTSSRMEVEKVTLKPTSLFGLAYASEEILQHSVISLAAIIEAGMNDEFNSEIFNEKINGTGAGEMEGILNSPAKVSITRNAGGNSIEGIDIINMRKRAWRYSRCIWLANHDCLGDLEVAHRSATNTDTFYFRAGSVIPGIGENASVDVPDTLLGRPIVFTEYVPALGTAGDLILWDPSQYLFGVGVGPGASGSAQSIHVRFENHERTFKFWQQNDGRCWWRSPLTPKNAPSNTLSPIVVLT